VPELQPAYLIWGDDEVRLDAWRTRLRARAEAEGAEGTLEVLRGERLSAEETAAATCALTLSAGRRYILADGVERWKEADVKRVATALAQLPTETMIVFIATGKAPPGLAKAVEGLGGEVHACEAPRPAAYPRWVVERARELGFGIDREAAQALVERTGTKQQRLLRELEKLAAFAGEGGTIDLTAVDAVTISAVEARTYELADALIEEDGERAMRLAEDLRARGEDLMHILFALLRQLRNCHRAWALVAAGKSAKDVQSDLRVPAFVARRLISQATRANPEQLERTLDLLAELDYAIRGAGNLDADSALTLTLARATDSARAAA
jgi:DNA polymerase-3 subunit delta